MMKQELYYVKHYSGVLLSSALAGSLCLSVVFDGVLVGVCVIECILYKSASVCVRWSVFWWEYLCLQVCTLMYFFGSACVCVCVGVLVYVFLCLV